MGKQFSGKTGDQSEMLEMKAKMGFSLGRVESECHALDTIVRS